MSHPNPTSSYTGPSRSNPIPNANGNTRPYMRRSSYASVAAGHNTIATSAASSQTSRSIRHTLPFADVASINPIPYGVDVSEFDSPTSVFDKTHHMQTKVSNKNKASDDNDDDGRAAFFIPEYLINSRYATRLTEAYNEKQAHSHVHKRQRSRPASPPPPLALSASASSVSLLNPDVRSRPSLPGSMPAPATPFPVSSTYSYRGHSYSVAHHREMQGYGATPDSSTHLGLGTFPGQHQNLHQSQTHNTSNLNFLLDSHTTPSSSLEDPPQPLPSRWSAIDKGFCLEVFNNGMQVKWSSINRTLPNPNPQARIPEEGHAVRADHPMPTMAGIYYFEVAILSKDRDGLVSVGFMGPKVTLNRIPGWEPNSWGYHGDDGKVHAAAHSQHSGQSGKPYRDPFGGGDTIGCGINFRTGTCFFTKNGLNCGVAFKDLKCEKVYYPAVGVRKPCDNISVNFGQTPFLFDIVSMYEKERKLMLAEVEAADISLLNPPDNEAFLMQKIVAQYLISEGFVNSARAFAKQVNDETACLKGNSHVSTLKLPDDLDLYNRQEIRTAIREGDIHTALLLAETNYPNALKRNTRVHFKLKCLKFMEMVRTSLSQARDTLHSKRLPDSSYEYEGVFAHDMELDSQPPPTLHSLQQQSVPFDWGMDSAMQLDDRRDTVPYDDDDDHISDGTNHHNIHRYGIPGVNQTDRRTGSEANTGVRDFSYNTNLYSVNHPPSDYHTHKQQHLQQQKDGLRSVDKGKGRSVSNTDLFAYGHKLQQEYGNDQNKEVQDELQKTLGSISYTNIHEYPLKQLLQFSKREDVADELNRTILVELGEAPYSALEKMTKDSEIMLRELGDDGGPGAYINLMKDFLGEPSQIREPKELTPKFN